MVLQSGLGRQRHRGRHNGHVHVEGRGDDARVGGRGRRHAGHYKTAAAARPAVVGVNLPPHQMWRVASAACPRRGQGRYWRRRPHTSQQDFEVLRAPPAERATVAIVVVASRPGRMVIVRGLAVVLVRVATIAALVAQVSARSVRRLPVGRGGRWLSIG